MQPDLQSDAPKFFRITAAPCARSDPFVLATLLTGRGGIENNFSDSSIRQREQMVNMPVDLLFSTTMPFESCSQSFHCAARVDIGPGGKNCLS